MTDHSSPDDELIERGMDLLPEFGRSVIHAIGRYHAVIQNGKSKFGGRGESHVGRGGPKGLFVERGGRHHRGGPHGRPGPGSLPGLKMGMYLFRRGPAKVGDIAEWLGVSPPTVSEQVDHLVKRGWVERRVNPEDRREVLVELTPKAIELVSYVNDLQRAQVQTVLEAFEPEERPIVIRTLEVFSQVLQRDPREVLAEISSRETG